MAVCVSHLVSFWWLTNLANRAKKCQSRLFLLYPQVCSSHNIYANNGLRVLKTMSVGSPFSIGFEFMHWNWGLEFSRRKHKHVGGLSDSEARGHVLPAACHVKWRCGGPFGLHWGNACRRCCQWFMQMDACIACALLPIGPHYHRNIRVHLGSQCSSLHPSLAPILPINKNSTSFHLLQTEMEKYHWCVW